MWGIQGLGCVHELADRRRWLEWYCVACRVSIVGGGSFGAKVLLETWSFTELGDDAGQAWQGRSRVKSQKHIPFH